MGDYDIATLVRFPLWVTDGCEGSRRWGIVAKAILILIQFT